MKKVCVNLWYVVSYHFQGIRNENTLVYLWSSNQIVFVWKKRKDQIAPNKMLVNRLSYQMSAPPWPQRPSFLPRVSLSFLLKRSLLNINTVSERMDRHF